jgi:putative ABC transport system permease protein
MSAGGDLPPGARLSTFGGVGLRSLRARPLRSALTAAGIVLGVGMVFGVLLLVGTISGTFNRLFDSVYGKADLVVSGQQSIGSLPERTLARVEGVDGVDVAVGQIYTAFRVVDEHGKATTDRSSQIVVAGVDPAAPDTTDSELVAGREPEAGREVQLAGGWAAEHDLEVGDRLGLAGPTGFVNLKVVGMFEFEGGLDLGGYGVGSMPVDAARPIMDKPAVWDEISVVAASGTSTAALRERLRGELGKGVDVVTPATKGDEASEQLQGLNVVLYFFSGIALFVGAFLILNSFNMTVLQRIREIGTLRALGASRGRVVRSVLGEAVILGVAGSALGLGVGLGLALGLVEVMRSFGLPIGGLELSAAAAVAAIVVGLVATALGALRPALRAGRIEPIRALTGDLAQRRRPGVGRAVVGLLMFVPGLIGGGLFWFSDASETGGALALVAGVGGTFVMLAGMVLLAPFVVMPLIALFAIPLRRLMPASGRLAADAVQSNPSRTAATAAALIVALSVVVVNATMAQSFVGSVKDELDRSLVRDVTVQPIGYSEYGGGPATAISRHLREEVAALPAADAVARKRAVWLPDLPAGGGQGLAVAFEPHEWSRVDATEYEGATREEVMRGLDAGGMVAGQGYADQVGLEVGDTVELDGASGARRAPVVGIADTLDASGQLIQVSLETMGQVYGIHTDSTLAVTATSPEDRAALERGIDRVLERYPAMEAISNAELKAQIGDEINQQFGLFNAIVGIAVLVGLLGIVNTLSMSVIERTRDIGVLRALGASRWSVRRTMADESLLISLAGCIAGIAAGLVVAFVWLYALRGTFPGISFQLPVGMLATIAVLGVVMGVLAAILPARRAARLDPLRALTYE